MTTKMIVIISLVLVSLILAACNLTDTDDDTADVPPITPTALPETNTDTTPLCELVAQNVPAEVYAQPDADETVGELPADTPVRGITQRNGFYQVSLPDGGSGWVARGRVITPDGAPCDFLPVASLPPTDQCLAVNVADSTVGVYADPSDAGNFLVRMAVGIAFPALAKQGDWIQVELTQETTGMIDGAGWIKVSETMLEGDCSALMP